MQGLDARTLASNKRLSNKLQALNKSIDDMKMDISDLVKHKAIYDLSSVRPSVSLPGRLPPPPRGWPCMPVTAWQLDKIQSLDPAEIKSAIEDLQERVRVISKIVKG
jgi:hypothetical protein